MSKSILRPNASRITFLQRLLDGLLIFSVYSIDFVLYDQNWDAKRTLISVLAAVLFALFAEIQGLYSSWRTSSLIDETKTVLYIWLMVISALLMLAFATKTSEIFSRLVVFTWFIAAPVTLVMFRVIVRKALRYGRRHGMNIRNVAVIGNNAAGHRLISHLESMSWSGLSIKGVFDRQPAESIVEIDRNEYSLEPVDNLLAKIRGGKIDSVYIALPFQDKHYIEKLVAQFADTTVSVYVVPDLFISELMRSRWIDFGGMPLVSVYETPFYGLSEWAKRAEDVILSSLILLLISPLMLVIAAAIKFTSTGPVLFKQRRYGLNGAVVEVWKFRSMSVCENGDTIPQATKGDARLTPLGAFLRRTSLDEFPQFINVLQGSMSIVGPRPHALVHNEQYRQLINGYMLRHKVKPGITGWAQINGWRGETDTLEKMQKRIEYDLEYIQNWSLWLDIEIIVLTIFRGFTGENAY